MLAPHPAADSRPVGGESFPGLTRTIMAKKGVLQNSSFITAEKYTEKAVTSSETSIIAARPDLSRLIEYMNRDMLNI